MRALAVHLDYSRSDSPQFRRGSSLGVALPVKILDVGGAIIADGVASLPRPAEFLLADEFDTVFVRLAWPSGRTETQRVNLAANGTAHVTFSDAKIAHNEWSAWAMPLLRGSTTRLFTGRSLDAYSKVWIRIWESDRGEWRPTPIVPFMQYKSEVARQIELELGPQAYLLQIGGSNVPWRFVALPGAGPCRVLLTPNDSKDPRADPLKIVVTSFRRDAEILLEFLARDAVRAASTMANSAELAESLFEEKFADPIGALAGAYFLLRIEDWERVPLGWWQNLSSSFPWIPDTAIAHCVRLLRAGLENERATTEAINLFKACIDRGWPVYEEGLLLLQEAGSLLRHAASGRDAEYFARVEALATAKTWAGAALSFYGKIPSRPSAVLWVGMPDAPRRRRLSRSEGVEELIDENRRALENTDQETASRVSRQMSSLAFGQELVPRRSVVARQGALRPPSLEATEESVGQISEVLHSDFRPPPFDLAEKPLGQIREIPHFESQAAKPRKERKRGDWLLLGDIGN